MDHGHNIAYCATTGWEPAIFLVNLVKNIPEEECPGAFFTFLQWKGP